MSVAQALLRSSFKASLCLLVKPAFSGWTPIGFQRAWMRAISATSLPPRGTRSQRLRMDQIPALRVSTGAPEGAAVLYLHGGGYCIGSPETHRALAGHIAKAGGAACFLPDYRLAPEHPHPAALEDALAAYRWLLAQPQAPSKIAIAGDSAGGGLTLALALAIRAAGLPQPAALVLMSPWTDLALTGASFMERAARDPILSPAIGRLWSRLYLGAQSPREPLCSPLYADLAGLPPMLLQVGSEEILLDDSRRLATRARAAGVAVTLNEYQGLWHDFQLQAGILQASDAAIAEIGAFLRQHWDRA